MAVYPATINLPDNMFVDIGRIIVAWAHLEWLLQESLYLAGMVNPKIGRMIVTEPKTKRRAELLKDVMEFCNIGVATDLPKLIQDIGKIEDERNKLAHGIWCDVPEQNIPMLRVTIGRLDSAQHGLKGRFTKKQLPELEPFTPELAQQRLAQIISLCERARTLRAEIQAHKPSLPRKHPLQSVP